MNGHDLRRAPGGQEQRVHGVNDVDFAGESLNRRPLQTMPREVEEGHWNAGVDDLKAGNHIGRQAVLP